MEFHFGAFTIVYNLFLVNTFADFFSSCVTTLHHRAFTSFLYMVEKLKSADQIPPAVCRNAQLFDSLYHTVSLTQQTSLKIPLLSISRSFAKWMIFVSK